MNFEESQAIAMTVLAAVLLGLVVGMFQTWAVLIRRWRRGEPFLEREPRRPVPWNLGDLVVLAVLYVVLQSALAAAFGVPLGSDGELRGSSTAEVASAPSEIEAVPSHEDAVEGKPPPTSSDKVPRMLAASGVANVAMFIVAIAYLRLRSGATALDLGFNGRTVLDDVRIGLAAFAAIWLPMYALQGLLTWLVPQYHPVIEELRDHPSVNMLTTGLVATVLIAPWIEELLFRVCLQGWLERVVGGAAPAEEPVVSVGDTSATQVMQVIPLDETPVHVEVVDAATSATRETNPFEAPRAESAAPLSLPMGPAPGGRRGSVAIAVSAMAFSLMHLGQGPAPITLFLFALVLGYVYERTHRLLPVVVIHTCLNLLSMLALWATLGGG